MALIIPYSVGGPAPTAQNQAVAQPTAQPKLPVVPIEKRIREFVVPYSVGGKPDGTVPASVPEASTLQEIGDAPELNQLSIPSFLASAGAMFTFDDAEVGSVLQSQFPGTKITADSSGDLVATFPSGQNFAINKSGFSSQDLVKTLGSIAAFIPAAKAAAVPATLLKKFGIGALASAGTQAVIEGGQTAIGGDFDKSEVAIAGGLGAAAELVAPAIQGVRQARISRSLGASADELAELGPTIAQGVEASAQTGVPLFQAQKTLLANPLQKQSFIASLPAGSLKASRELKVQNKAAGDAVDNFLNSIAPADSIITGPENFRSASKNAIERARELRAEKASPLYKQAFEQELIPDTTGITENLKTTILKFPKTGEVSTKLTQVLEMLSSKEAELPKDLEQLHNIKIEIDQMINKVGESALGNTTKAKLLQVKNDLLTAMDFNPLYKEARQTFAENSGPVRELKESVIGKVAALKDIDLKSASLKIFNPSETNPAVVRKAREIITQYDPDAWNQLLRVELERRLGSIKPTQGETIENIPGQLYRAVFGNDKQTKVLYQGLDDVQSKNLKYLQTVLGRARLGRPGGSQTATNEEIKRELGGGALKSINNFMKQGLSTITMTGAEGVASNRRVKALAEIMYDPQWAPRMKEIRALKPNSPGAATAMAKLLNDAIPARATAQILDDAVPAAAREIGELFNDEPSNNEEAK
tara:strand:- start:25906 stop:28017 length:2112 start_codon:yes stop_codon:yes gene_type:complete